MIALIMLIDPILALAIQYDVIAYHAALGEPPVQVCAIAEEYFAVDCRYADGDFVLTRGSGSDITYLATIHVPPKDAP